MYYEVKSKISSTLVL